MVVLERDCQYSTSRLHKFSRTLSLRRVTDVFFFYEIMTPVQSPQVKHRAPVHALSAPLCAPPPLSRGNSTPTTTRTTTSELVSMVHVCYSHVSMNHTPSLQNYEGSNYSLPPIYIANLISSIYNMPIFGVSHCHY